jgi:hypothetical protein
LKLWSGFSGLDKTLCNVRPIRREFFKRHTGRDL